jgi:transcriptional regulator with XRE-family HTH domain
MTLAVAKEPSAPPRLVKTIDQVIGLNLRALRHREALTLAEAAEGVAFLTGRPVSEPSLSRWETGYNHFTVPDLYEWSQIYGVNIIALLQPADDVTHVHVNGRDVPVGSYAYDFFIDPRGTFTDRARNIAERNAEGTRDVVDALNDITDRLGEKGRPADLLAAINTVRLRDAVAANPEVPAWQTAIDLYNAGDLYPADETERHDDGVTQEDE